MPGLVLPARVRLQVEVWANGHAIPYRGQPLAFKIRTFARAKNDIVLGPLFTDATGVLDVGRRQLQLLVAREVSTGLMDYRPLEDAYPLVEIVHESSAEIADVLEALETVWRSPLEGEAELYGSRQALLANLRAAGNAQFEPPAEYWGRVRDEWTDSSRDVQYRYTLLPKRSA